MAMEDKLLDFNRPLLSVRRPTKASESETKPRSFDSVTNKIPPCARPVYKSDMKSGPVRNPGTVPFQWEHMPGKPKDQRKEDVQSFGVPKLPPGRVRGRQVSVEDAKSCTCGYDDDDDDDDGTLSSDRETQDLMMGRLLPAAKALTSETPLSRKPEEDGETSSMMASGVCGLVPQSSFGLLNPVPSVRMQAQRAVSVRRMRSKYQDSNTQNQNKQNDGSVSQVVKSGTSRTKVSRNFGELLASDDNTWKPSSEAPLTEKTLYVDTVHSVDNLTGLIEEAISLPKTSEKSVKRDEDFTEEFPDQAIVALPHSNAVVEITKEKTDLQVKLHRNTKNLETSRLHHRSTYHIVPPPPLPKAPSDSWLKRTLPSIPSKNNSFSWLQSLGADNNNHLTKTNQANPKCRALERKPENCRT